MATNETDIVRQDTDVVDIETCFSPQEMARRLGEMKQKLGLVQSFFKEVMVPNQDYGTIPGTDKPTLLKSGAEKLCELYGYEIRIRDREETADRDTGYYRAVITVALVHRRTGVPVAEGVGEANTYEGRYRWRWTPEWKLPKGLDTSDLVAEERKNRNGKPYIMYRLENEDPWTLWNTVLKMAKKRALVDAVLSATRSSGLFTQDVEDLQDWVQSGATIDVDADDVTSSTSSKKSNRRNAKKKEHIPADLEKEVLALLNALDIDEVSNEGKSICSYVRRSEGNAKHMINLLLIRHACRVLECDEEQTLEEVKSDPRQAAQVRQQLEREIDERMSQSEENDNDIEDDLNEIINGEDNEVPF